MIDIYNLGVSCYLELQLQIFSNFS